MSDSSSKKPPPNPSSLESAQAAVIAMSPGDRQRLGEWLKSFSAPTFASDRFKGPASAPEVLYQSINSELRLFGYVTELSYQRWCKLKPGLSKNLDLHARTFEAALHTLFKGCSLTEMNSVRAFLVHCAAKRLEERGWQINLQGILDALIPLEELVDYALPDYRNAGVLKDELVRALRYKGST